MARQGHKGKSPSLCVGESGHAYICKVQWSVELVDMNLWNTINLKSENLIINLQINKISVLSLYPYPEIFYIKFIIVQLFIRWVVPCPSPSDGEYGKMVLTMMTNRLKMTPMARPMSRPIRRVEKRRQSTHTEIMYY